MNKEKEEEKYTYYIEEKEKKNSLLKSIGLVFIPIILFFLFKKEISFMEMNRFILILVIISVFLYYLYQIYEIIHILNYYKDPITIQVNKLRYKEKLNTYNEIDLSNAYTLKIYKKNKRPNLIEIMDRNEKILGTVYLKGFSYKDVNRLIVNIKDKNKQIIITS